MERDIRERKPGHSPPHERFVASRPYVEQQEAIPVASREDEVDTQLRRFAKLVPVSPGTSLLEMGMGSGWMVILAAQRGLRATGLEHNPELAELARRRAEAAGVSIDIRVGAAESYPLEPGAFDIVVANSLLEHVPDYRAAIENAYTALRPGGLFYFNSTNKFSLRSGEYPPMRLYGWLPYRMRRAIRIRKQGPEIVSSAGMDFNQFTYRGLRRTLADVGFSRVLDIYELLEVGDLNRATLLRTTTMRVYKRFPPLRWLLTNFSDGTYIYCVK